MRQGLVCLGCFWQWQAKFQCSGKKGWTNVLLPDSTAVHSRITFLKTWDYKFIYLVCAFIAVVFPWADSWLTQHLSRRHHSREGVGAMVPSWNLYQWIYLMFCVGRSHGITAEDPVALVIDILSPSMLEDTWVTAMGKATKNPEEEETAFLSSDPPHIPHTHIHTIAKKYRKIPGASRQHTHQEPGTPEAALGPAAWLGQ